ncbi:hypothetical protein [Natronorubrum sp. DTA7]|uniref:hypothetical protein n=1 Tax=Natronorubrum sp. DTA7 TaxID=3447016 RepID=UPI003F825884
MTSDSGGESPSLKELFQEGFHTYLKRARSMIIDDHDPGDEVKILITAHRTVSNRNIWDIGFENDSGDFILLDTWDIESYDSASSLANDMAKKAGVDFDQDDSEEEIEFGQTPDSPAFR